MAEVTLVNVQEILHKTVKPDGRVGGLQPHIGEDVDIVIYRNGDE